MVARHAPEHRPGMDRNRGPAWTGIRNSTPLPNKVEKMIESERNEHLARVPGYVEQIRFLNRKLSEVRAENGWSRPVAANAIRAGLLDLPTVRLFTREVRDPEGHDVLPPVETLGPESAVVIHFQVTHALALQRALDHALEFESDDYVQRLNPALARELFDADYLMLGVLEGGIATHEKRLRRIFRWLRPDGRLYPPEADG